jgi:pimeloyl-ACP methyl ester carboxylesterase
MPIKLPPIKPRPKGARKRALREERNLLETQRPPTTHGYVKSFDGTRLFYSVEGTGKPLVFCYGLVCSSLHWTYQIDYFRKNYQTIWFDYRGHQNSEVPKNLQSLTVQNLARDMGVILDELGIQESVILGHSMGVNAVLEFYRQQPDRVTAMVVANGTPRRPLETLFSHNALQAAFKILKKAYQHSPDLVEAAWKLGKGNPLMRTLITLGGFNPHLTPPEDVALYVDQVAEMNPAVFIHLIQNYDSVDSTSWLHTITKPTLIIAGEEDKIIPIELQELMNQLIPESRLEKIKHGSHCPQMDLPELVNLKIEKFLTDIKYVSAPTPTTENASQPTHPSAALGLEGAS